MRYRSKMQIDWNPVIHILDTLSEGTHSFLELSYMVQHYDREAFCESLVFLAERELIELSAGQGPFQTIPSKEWPNRLRKSFSADHADQTEMVNTAVDLTQRGEQVLALLQIGHP